MQDIGQHEDNTIETKKVEVFTENRTKSSSARTSSNVSLAISNIHKNAIAERKSSIGNSRSSKLTEIKKKSREKALSMNLRLLNV